MATLYKFSVFDLNIFFSFFKVRSFFSFGLHVRWTFLHSSCASDLIHLHWETTNSPSICALCISILLVLGERLFCIIIIYVVHCHFVTINFLSERLMVAFDRNEMVNLNLFHFFESFVVTTCVQPFIYLMRKTLYRVKVFLLYCIFWLFCTLHFRLLTIEGLVRWR